MKYKLEPKFEEIVLSFFKDLFGFNREAQITILDNEEYNKKLDKESGASVFPLVVKGDPQAENLLKREDKIVWKIYIRRFKGGVDLNSTIHEFLHIYYPKASERKIETANIGFDYAFECYEALYDDNP